MTCASGGMRVWLVGVILLVIGCDAIPRHLGYVARDSLDGGHESLRDRGMPVVSRDSGEYPYAFKRRAIRADTEHGEAKQLPSEAGGSRGVKNNYFKSADRFVLPGMLEFNEANAPLRVVGVTTASNGGAVDNLDVTVGSQGGTNGSSGRKYDCSRRFTDKSGVFHCYYFRFLDVAQIQQMNKFDHDLYDSRALCSETFLPLADGNFVQSTLLSINSKEEERAVEEVYAAFLPGKEEVMANILILDVNYTTDTYSDGTSLTYLKSRVKNSATFDQLSNSSNCIYYNPRLKSYTVEECCINSYNESYDGIYMPLICKARSGYLEISTEVDPEATTAHYQITDDELSNETSLDKHNTSDMASNTVPLAKHEDGSHEGDHHAADGGDKGTDEDDGSYNIARKGVFDANSKERKYECSYSFMDQSGEYHCYYMHIFNTTELIHMAKFDHDLYDGRMVCSETFLPLDTGEYVRSHLLAINSEEEENAIVKMFANFKKKVQSLADIVILDVNYTTDTYTDGSSLDYLKSRVNSTTTFDKLNNYDTCVYHVPRQLDPELQFSVEECCIGNYSSSYAGLEMPIVCQARSGYLNMSTVVYDNVTTAGYEGTGYLNMSTVVYDNATTADHGGTVSGEASEEPSSDGDHSKKTTATVKASRTTTTRDPFGIKMETFDHDIPSKSTVGGGGSAKPHRPSPSGALSGHQDSTGLSASKTMATSGHQDSTGLSASKTMATSGHQDSTGLSASTTMTTTELRETSTHKKDLSSFQSTAGHRVSDVTTENQNVKSTTNDSGDEILVGVAERSSRILEVTSPTAAVQDSKTVSQDTAASVPPGTSSSAIPSSSTVQTKENSSAPSRLVSESVTIAQDLSTPPNSSTPSVIDNRGTVGPQGSQKRLPVQFVEQCALRYEDSNLGETFCYHFFPILKGELQMFDDGSEWNAMSALCADLTVILNREAKKANMISINSQAEMDYVTKIVKDTTRIMQDASLAFQDDIVLGVDLRVEWRDLSDPTFIGGKVGLPSIKKGDCIHYSMSAQKYSVNQCRMSGSLENEAIWVMCKARFGGKAKGHAIAKREMNGKVGIERTAEEMPTSGGLSSLRSVGSLKSIAMPGNGFRFLRRFF